MHHPVIIIGAGVAGLSAADTLLAAGVTPLILEASDRPGGRVRALEGFADFPIELGAEEVHGAESSTYTLAMETGAGIIRHRTRDDVMRLDGSLISLEEALCDPEVAWAAEILRTVGDYAGENWTAEEWLRRIHFPRRARHYLESRLGVENGTSLDRLAMRGFEGYERGWENREWNFTLRESYLDIFTPLIARLGGRIHLNTPVREVDWSGTPRVRLVGGGELTADAVVATVSVAVLQKGGIGFSPELPAERREALRAVGMDGGMKVILQFRERFWEEQMYFLHTDGFLPQYWAAGKGKSGEAVLTAFVGGGQYDWLKARAIDPVAFALGELDRVFGGRPGRTFCRGHVADWGADPWVGGLYSYPVPATTRAVRHELGRTLAGRLYFAGEATDADGKCGTVHGAVDSGRRVAEEILLGPQSALGIGHGGNH